MTAMIVTGMELVQTPLDPLNVFATMDTLETDAIVRVEYNFKLLLPLWQKVQNFLQNSGFAKVAKVGRNKQTNRQIHTRVIMFVYFGNKSKRVGKKEGEELNKGLNYVQRILKQQKQN